LVVVPRNESLCSEWGKKLQSYSTSFMTVAKSVDIESWPISETSNVTIGYPKRNHKPKFHELVVVDL